MSENIFSCNNQWLDGLKGPRTDGIDPEIPFVISLAILHKNPITTSIRESLPQGDSGITPSNRLIYDFWTLVLL